MFRFSAILTQVRISEKFIIVRNMAKNPSVIIVGAGVSGIAAATKLLENGFVSLTVLEAENKIGGRVCSVEFGGSFVDLGGQWVHGEKGNLVYQKVKDLDLLSTSHNTFSDNTYYLSNGSIVDKDITDRLFAIGMEIIDDKEGAKNGTGSVGDYFIKVFYEAVSKEFGHNENVLKIAKLLESWLEKFFFCLNSESWFNISTNGAHVFESCEGDQQLNWRDKGYRTILDVLMKKIPDATKQLPLDDKIFLNKEVSKITWDNNTTNFNGVTVNCSDGSTFNADHVIVTTSLGVLKKFHESLFIPELPPYKINSIEGIGLGTVNKILLKFPTKWWSNDLKGINLLWTEEDRVNLHKESHLFGPSENSDNGRCWLEDIFGFYVIDSHPRVLLAFVVGKSAPKVELLSDELVIGGCMYLLKKFSGWKYEIPEADEVLRKPKHHKIVIMGAGMAGLGAALKLTELGCKDFVILEAQEEIGGRIKTITVDGRPLDIGAQWLHGKDNPLYHLAVKHDLLSEKMSEEGLGMFIRNDGVMFDDFLVKRVDFEVGRILEDCQTFVDKIEHPVSVGDFMEQKFLEYLDACDDTNNLRQMKLELFDWHMRFQVIDNSCQNMKRLSAKYWGSYVCLDDTAHYNLKYGYDSLINVMADSLPKESIHLDCEVTEILYGEKHNGVKVICSNNQIFYCDHLIITASIGVLKEFAIIDPPLPTLLQTAIDNMGFYGIGKIYLIFDEKWWGNWKGFQFMWKSDTSYEEGEEWIRHVTGFDEVFNQPKVLIGWVGGEGVKEMESLTEDEVGNTCINVLRKFLPDFKIPQPNNVIRTKWFSNPWVKGSYCHITPECDDPHSGMDKMSEPVFVRGVPRIILAGEAVHPSHYSTTHGAFESGQEQAAVLHKYIMRE